MSPALHSLSLDGDWTLHRPATNEDFPARVPGCSHLDLFRAGVLPSMDWRDNEATQQGLDAESWVYRRAFTLTPEQLAMPNIELVCEGLDTFATVILNGAKVLETDNMFRTWRAPAAPLLREGENQIEITFHSTLPAIEAGQAKRPLREWNIYFDRHHGRGYVRKMACSYGWDWGPVAVTAGIWKSIRLDFVCGARWNDVRLRQTHAAGQVTLDVAWEIEGEAAVRFELWREGTLVASSTDGKLVVENPKLWWPNTLGAQPLYDFRAILTDASGAEDRWERRVGLRALRLVREKDAGGESFYFEINGRVMFCRGANWVPHRVLLPSITREDYARLLQDTVDSNMNMLRVWGGGIYENEDFYDLCDELGILVWQDFPFACGAYPSWDPAFLASVEAEARDNVRRLRHRPSLALWCGNNELEGPNAFVPRPEYTWEEYGALFDELLPRVCAELDPDRAYWPSSPHSTIGPRVDSDSDLSGDVHHWSVFFGRQSFESQRDWRCRFMSEYGFQSFPELRTVESYTEPEDRTFMSRIMDYRQRSEVGNQTIFTYLLDWFQVPRDFGDTLTLSQITQSLCVRYGAEHLRRLQPHCGGVLYWQINDIWPCATWSSIDSFGRWKVLQYEAKRFFAPVLVSIEEDLLTCRARIHISNQLPDDAMLDVRWQITTTDGTILLENTTHATVPSQSGHYVADLDAKPLLEHHYAPDLMVWAWASHQGRVVSRNWATLARPKHMSLAQPNLRTEINGSTVRVTCEKPAPYVQLSVAGEDAWFEDNFFHLHPAEPREIRLTRGPAPEVLAQKLAARCLADWMPARAGLLAPRAKNYELQRKRNL